MEKKKKKDGLLDKKFKSSLNQPKGVNTIALAESSVAVVVELRCP